MGNKLVQMPYKVLVDASMNITQPDGAVHYRQVAKGDVVLLVDKSAKTFLEKGWVEPINPTVDNGKVSQRKTKKRKRPLTTKG